MKRSRFCFLASVLFSLPVAAWGGKPTWAKKGVGIVMRCVTEGQKTPGTVRIPSPNGKNLIEVRYEALPRDQDAYCRFVAAARVTADGREVGAACPRGADPGYDDVLWSPDSTKFFVNANGGSAIGPHYVDVYLLDDSKLAPFDISFLALKDMVATFPPCRVSHIEYDCHELEKHPESYISVSAVDWLPDSSAIVVMAEVIPSGRFGGILGQVMGYVIEVPSGKVLRRMEAREFGQLWQSSMAFSFRVPEPPEYEDGAGK